MMKINKLAVSAIAVFFVAVNVMAQTPDTDWYTANPGAASFTISTADELAGLAEIVNGTWGGEPLRDEFAGKIIILDADIDLSVYDNWVAIGKKVTGLFPVGVMPFFWFTGTFDGRGYVVRNLTINRPGEEFQGLFGPVSGAVVKNLGVENVNIRAGNTVGGLAAATRNESRITNCYVTGTVAGREGVGGLVGNVASGVNNTTKTRYDCQITNSYFSGTVTGTDYVGGLSGSVFAGTLINCYFTGTVTGNNYTGGLTGRIDAQSVMANCYSTGTVSGNNYVGGVTGYTSYSAITDNAALNPQVKGYSNVGRVAGGYGYPTIANNTVVPGLRNNVAFSGMKNSESVSHWINKGADTLDGADITSCEINSNGTVAELFVDAGVWTIQNGKLPGLFGKMVAMPEHLPDVADGCREVVVDECAGIAYNWYTSSPGARSFTISTACELAGLAEIVNGTWGGVPDRDDFSGKTITLTNNIDLSPYDNWVPIGVLLSPLLTSNKRTNAFSGKFDGGGHVISNLTIVRHRENYQGLFGYINGGKVENLGLDRVNIFGGDYVGAVAGEIRDGSRVTNCYSTGTVSGNNYIGGVVGNAMSSTVNQAKPNGYDSHITNNYFDGMVRGRDFVGGVVGGVYAGTVISCYSSGTVSGNEFVGGVAGRTGAQCVLANSYSTGTVSGTNIVGGVTGFACYNELADNAALNFEVKGFGNVGRVVGLIYNRTTIPSNNVAFAEMKNNDGDTAWANRGAAGLDGKDISACEINMDGTINGLFADSAVWTAKNGNLPGLFGRTVAMPEHLKNCLGLVIPQDTVSVDTTVTDTAKVLCKGGLTVGPNPVSRRTGPLKFYRECAQIADAALTIFDASGNVVATVRISDNSGNQDRRLVGSWNLRNAKGNQVPEGAYLIKGTIVTLDGKRERVSIIVGVR